MYKHGFVKMAFVSPKSKIGDVAYNLKEIKEALAGLKDKGVEMVFLPSMALTGEECNDLLAQEYLYKDSLEALDLLIKEKYPFILCLGSYIIDNGNMYKGGFVMQNGHLLGIASSFYASSYFSAFEGLKEVSVLGHDVPFGNIIFSSSDGVVNFALEDGKCLLGLGGTSGYMFSNGANLIVNMNYQASSVDENDKSKTLAKAKSIVSNGAYAVVSVSSSLSSSEIVPNGLICMYVNGEERVLEEKITTDTKVVICDLDFSQIAFSKRNSGNKHLENVCHITFDLKETEDFQFEGAIDKSPFLRLTDKDIETIIDTQAISLINRLCYIGTKKTVIGVSGGLDSTLALLSMCYAYDKMGWDRKDIHALTLPTGNTSSKTYSSAWGLMEKLKVSCKEININEDVERQLKTIGHDDSKDVTYENIQARFRTYTLMNTANMIGGIVVGTSDMSEVALGWSTFNGDQMAMYGLNAGLPKTVVREVVRYFSNIYSEVEDILLDVINTPISPELASSNQLTEQIIGKYEINDFILYNMIRNGYADEKLCFMIEKAFDVKKDIAIKYINNFNKRFFHQQFKRLTMPEGVRLLWFSLSPRKGLCLSGDIHHKSLID